MRFPSELIVASAHVVPGTTVAEVIEQVGFARLVPDVDLGQRDGGHLRARRFEGDCRA